MKNRSVRGSEISATRKADRLEREVMNSLGSEPQSTRDIMVRVGHPRFVAVREAVTRLWKRGFAVKNLAGGAVRWCASEKLIAERDARARRRLIAALDGTHPLACSNREIQALARWCGAEAWAGGVMASAQDRAALAASFVLCKLLGKNFDSMIAEGGWLIRPRPASVLVIDNGARWAYDVVNVGPSAIELRYTGASAERETRMFRRNDGVAIGDPKVRIASEDLAALTGRTTAEVARAAGEAAGREVERELYVGRRVRGLSGPHKGRVGYVSGWSAPFGKEPACYVIAIDRVCHRVPVHEATVMFEHIPENWSAFDAAMKGLGGEGPNLTQPKDGPDPVELLDHVLAKHGVPIDRPDIHAQIDAWTQEALQGLALRVSARVWQAYRAGQGQSGGSYSETGHELAAQEAERLRGVVERLTDKLRSTQREWDKTRETLNKVAGARQAAEQERDTARAALGDIQEELHLAETSLVTTAKERDDAADKVRELSGQLQERADQWAKAIVDKSAAQQERDAARAELADLRAGISALTSGRAA